MIWYILGIISIISLIRFWGGKNAVWGGFTIGLLIALIITIFWETGFDWYAIAKGGIVGTLVGLAVELLWIVSNKLSKK